MSRFVVGAMECEALRDGLRLFIAEHRGDRDKVMRQVVARAELLLALLRKRSDFPLTPLSIGILRRALVLWTARAVAVMLCDLSDDERRGGDAAMAVVQALGERLAKADIWDLPPAGAA